MFRLRSMFAGAAVCAAFAIPAPVLAQSATASVFPPPPPLVSPAAGAIDIHVHSAPDVFGRNMSDLDVARLAKARGMRGLLLKNHVTETAARAALLMEAVPGLEVWGGIALNRAVGGVNADAVEWMYRMSGGRGKVVWLPTFDADHHMKSFVGKDASGLRVAIDGKVTPETEAVLKVMARENLSLATGHVSAAEVMVVVKRAKELGVKNIVVTHALAEVPGLTLEQVKEVTAMGAMIEYVYLNELMGPQAQQAWMRHWRRVSIPDLAKVVKEIGADHIIVSSDLGQSGNPVHPDGIEATVRGLRAAGIAQAEVDKLVKHNPARWLGAK
ncbi:MAG: DUF6282 family protein [Burkholderiales bacterium]